MGDEIRNANVLTVQFHSPSWVARIGPPGLGIQAIAFTAAEAVSRLAQRCADRGWHFDPTWRPGKTHFHDV